MCETMRPQMQLPLIRSIPATKYIIDMTLLAQKLLLANQDNSKIKFASGNYDIKVALTGLESWDITRFDVIVYTAAASLYEAGNKAFTVPMLARVIVGYHASDVSPNLCAEIEKSVNKLNALTITIHAPDRLYSDRLLRVAPYKARNDNGTICVHYGYVIEPVLLGYAKKLGHLYTYPIESVNTIAKMNNTMDVIVVRHYVLWRVAVAIRTHKYSRIAYETIAKDCNVSIAKARRICKRVLDHLTEIDYINSYSEYRKERKYVGVNLTGTAKSGKSGTRN